MRAALFLLPILAACASDAARAECPVADTGDAGDLTALAAQRCNVSGSMGASHWYRLSATLPGDPTAPDIVQLELYDNRGGFGGGVVRPGTFEITGDELAPATCGICLRAIADKGGETQREYFATGGTVEVTAVGPEMDVAFVATITGASFEEIDADKVPVADGCTVDVARVKVSGTIEIKGGTGGGGGGGSGSGSSNCVLTVGD